MIVARVKPTYKFLSFTIQSGQSFVKTEDRLVPEDVAESAQALYSNYLDFTEVAEIEVEEPKPAPEPEPLKIESFEQLMSLPKAELVSLGKKLGLEFPVNATKEQLSNAILEKMTMPSE